MKNNTEKETKKNEKQTKHSENGSNHKNEQSHRRMSEQDDTDEMPDPNKKNGDDSEEVKRKVPKMEK